MLVYSPVSPSATATPFNQVKVNGHKLSRRLRGMSPAHRALIAYELESGAVTLHDLTRKQATALTNASLGYVATISRASPQEREQLKHGQLSLTQLHNKPPTDQQIDRLIIRIGADRVMAALDRWKRPQFRFAAE